MTSADPCLNWIDGVLSVQQRSLLLVLPTRTFGRKREGTMTGLCVNTTQISVDLPRQRGYLTVLVTGETGKLERGLKLMHFGVQSNGCAVTDLEVAPFEADDSHTVGFYNLDFDLDLEMLALKSEKKGVEITVIVTTNEGLSGQTKARL